MIKVLIGIAFSLGLFGWPLAAIEYPYFLGAFFFGMVLVFTTKTLITPSEWLNFNDKMIKAPKKTGLEI